jgi:hypothetical protein
MNGANRPRALDGRDRAGLPYLHVQAHPPDPPLFILSAGCKDDEPTAKFGEPCGRDESEPDCADDLQCEGYCAPRL